MAFIFLKKLFDYEAPGSCWEICQSISISWLVSLKQTAHTGVSQSRQTNNSNFLLTQLNDPEGLLQFLSRLSVSSLIDSPLRRIHVIRYGQSLPSWSTGGHVRSRLQCLVSVEVT